MRYDDTSILECYLCPCQVKGDRLQTTLEATGKDRFNKCSNCFYPWPILSQKEEFDFCQACRRTEVEEMTIPHVCCGFTCRMCGGYIPHCAVLDHFRRIASDPDVTSDETKGLSQQGSLCQEHDLQYRFIGGKFKRACSSCQYRREDLDDQEVRDHFQDFRICCAHSRVAYSAVLFQNHLLIFCRQCLSVFVSDFDDLRQDWLSSGEFGRPFCERKVYQLSEILVGDHLFFERAFYEHHVIVMWVNKAGGTFKDVGYSTPKVPGSSDEEHLMIGRVLMLEVVFRRCQDPMVVVDYLPLDVYPPGRVLRRACSRLEEEGYSILSNNCEHLTTWCKYGRGESGQMRKAVLRCAERGTDLVIRGVGPTVAGVCAQMREDPRLRQAQEQVLLGAQTVKEVVGRSLQQMLAVKKPLKEEPGPSKGP